MKRWREILLVILASAICCILSPTSRASTTFENVFGSRLKVASYRPTGESVHSKNPRYIEERRPVPNSSRYDDRGGARTIEVHTKERALYLFTKNGRIIRYKVGVGRAGQQWIGSTKVVSKQVRPAWTPPDVIRGNKPAWVAEPGSPKNPMGAAALVLADHELAIHGTNDPRSIGGYVSWGCIRMYNRDVMDLYSRVAVGTPVVIKR